MDNLIVKKAVSVTEGKGTKNEYLLVGKKNGRNCLFRIWRGVKSDVFIEAYNVSLYEAETRLDPLLSNHSAQDIAELDLESKEDSLKANIILKWLKEHGHLEKPIGNSPIRVAHLLHVYKGRKKEDPRVLVQFFNEDSAWLMELKLSKSPFWENPFEQSGVFPICVWGKGESCVPSAMALITDYISFVGMNGYVYHELNDVKAVGLTEDTLVRLSPKTEFIWTPQEEQIGLPSDFIPEIQYRAVKVYTIPFLWREKQPSNCYGIMAWNDEGKVEMVKQPK